MATHTAYIKIAEGCDRPCAFCIIPKLRGPQRSRDPESVVREAQALAAAGTKEVCLVAQDLTTYGTDLPDAKAPDAPNLASLLRGLGGVEGLRWIRLHYAYPTACTNELLDVMASEARVAKYLDVPIQHVDSGVLKSMRRGYGEKQVRDLCERVRARVPGVTLRTTFIVGHPGETEEAFQRLCDFVREAELDRVGVFNFSREEGTVAALLPEARAAEGGRRAPPRAPAHPARDLEEKLRALVAGRRSRCSSRVRRTSPSTCSWGVTRARRPRSRPGLPVVHRQRRTEAPTPARSVRARVTHSAGNDLAAEIAA
jgi:ribosomal protein S12 methylthiotransferase